MIFCSNTCRHPDSSIGSDTEDGPTGSRMGRKHHSKWKELRFTPVLRDGDSPKEKGNQFKAQCEICKKILSNTCASRFQMHRFVPHRGKSLLSLDLIINWFRFSETLVTFLMTVSSLKVNRNTHGIPNKMISIKAAIP